MKRCPIMSYRSKDIYSINCFGKDCAWSDKEGNCLIAQALKTKLTTTINQTTEIKEDGITLKPVSFDYFNW